MAVISGTGGIGRSLAHDLAKQGAEAPIVGQTLRDAQIGKIIFSKADLGLRDARRVAAELPGIVIVTTLSM